MVGEWNREENVGWAPSYSVALRATVRRYLCCNFLRLGKRKGIQRPVLDRIEMCDSRPELS